MEKGTDEKTNLTNSWNKSSFRWLLLVLCSYGSMETGIAYSLIGTTLPMLQAHFHSSLNIASGFFLIFGCFGAIGNLLTPVLLRFCHIYSLISVARLMNGLALIIIVMSPYTAVAFSGFAAIGVCVGVSGNAVYHLSNLRFPDKPYVFHVLAMTMSFGGFICPLIAGQFVSDIIPGSVSAQNGTVEYMDPNVTYHLRNQEPPGASLKHIYIAFAVITLPTFIGFAVLYLKDKCVQDAYEPLEVVNSQSEKKNQRLRLAFLVSILLMCFSCYAVAFVHGSFITTLTEKGPMTLSARKATRQVSVFWFMVLIGRIIGIGASAFVNQVLILWTCFLGSVFSILMLVLNLYQPRESLYLTGTFLLGLFAGPQYAALMTWSQTHFTLTSFLIGLYNVLTYIGSTSLSFAAGQLIASFGESTEPYFCLAFELFKIVSILFAQGVSRRMTLR